MGALTGLLLGLGLVLVVSAFARVAEPTPQAAAGRSRLTDLVTESGVPGASVSRLVAAVAICVGVTGFLALGISRSPAIALAFAVIAGASPISYLRWRRRQRADELRAVWPDVVDNLASGVRAGLSLPEALSQLSTRGPEPLRAVFGRFSEDYPSLRSLQRVPRPAQGRLGRSGR